MQEEETVLTGSPKLTPFPALRKSRVSSGASFGDIYREPAYVDAVQGGSNTLPGPRGRLGGKGRLGPAGTGWDRLRGGAAHSPAPSPRAGARPCPQRPLGKRAAAIDELGRSTEGPARRCGVRLSLPEAGRLSPVLGGEEEAAAAAEQQQFYPRSSIEDDFNYGSNVASASVHIRMAFLRKVYSILSIQVLLTTVTSAIFLYSTGVQAFVHERPALLLISAFGSLAIIVALTIYRHQHPVNLYLLFGFTLLEALTVAITVSFYDVSIVLQAFILTTAVFLGLTAYTLQSKRDFSKFGAGLFACLWILIFSGFLRLFFYSETMELVFAAAGALLFCGFIIYDTHLLMHKLSPEEYILAAINLYLDIINLFLHLLRLLETFNKK
ncbi:PREDICTED: protein lifeguard 4 [Haliaeetus leucocephalus]|uniref:protein lifeguard 4 n=1 Tax=Haliaeetus leucocephalus TaxID=52644 RepID=UPI00053CBECB|nr:PREDICTED: protein lifeguard 4 [Haliaeetus leucocephalus]